MIRRLFGAVAVILALATPSWAQLPVGGSLGVLNATVAVNPAAAVALTFGVTGTYSGTITFQCSTDGANYTSILATAIDTGTATSTTTSTGNFSVPNVGCVSLQAKMTSYVSGIATITITRGFWNARLFNPIFGSVTLAANGALTWTGQSTVLSPSDGVLTLLNNAQTGFTRLNFGGTTSSFPALKVNGSGMDCRLADDGGACSFFDAGTLTATGAQITGGSGTGITVNGTGDIRSQVYKVTVASTNFIAAATTADVTLGTLPAKTAISAVIADLTQVFACGSVCTSATLSMTCGKTAGGAEYLVSWNLNTTTGQFGLTQATIGTALKYATPPITLLGDLPSWSGTTAVQCRMTSGTGNIGTGAATNLSQGSVTFYLVTTRLP